MVPQTGIEPATFGYHPDALPLSYYRVFTWRNTKPETGRASRDHNEPEPMAKAKERVNNEASFSCKSAEKIFL